VRGLPKEDAPAMSYMRHPYYAWTDGTRMMVSVAYDPTQLEMPLEIFDELVAMRWAQLTNEQRQEAIRRALCNHAGNGGCDALCKAAGVPGFLDQIEKLAAKRKARRGR
jgi:hypothetical protein